MAAGNARWDLGVWDPEDEYTGKDGKKTQPPGYSEGQPRNYMQLSEDFRAVMQGFIDRMGKRVADKNLNSMGFAVSADDGEAILVIRKLKCSDLQSHSK